MNKNQDFQIVKFLSIIFNPNNYPLSIKKIKNISEGLFNSKFGQKILENFEFANNKYFIKNKSEFSPKKVITAIKKSLNLLNKTDYLYILSIAYNSADDYKKFYRLLNKNKKGLNTKKIKQAVNDAILSIKPEKYLDDKSMLDLKVINDIDNFTHYETRFYNYYSPFEFNKCICVLFKSINALKIYNWIEMIDLLPHKFLKLMYNAEDFFFPNNTTKFLNQINKKSSDDIISFALLNCISSINHNNKSTSINFLFKILDKLATPKKFYYLGILISNAEYILNKNLQSIFELKTNNYLSNIISKVLKNKQFLTEFKRGLKNTSRDCHLKCFGVLLKKYQTENPKLAILLAKEIISDYETKIFNKDPYNLLVHTEKECEYCNCIIHSIIFLLKKNKLNIYKLFSSWNNTITMNIDDFQYSYSSQIGIKNKA